MAAVGASGSSLGVGGVSLTVPGMFGVPSGGPAPPPHRPRPQQTSHGRFAITRPGSRDRSVKPSRSSSGSRPGLMSRVRAGVGPDRKGVEKRSGSGPTFPVRAYGLPLSGGKKGGR
jgi:hypothetical protein